MSEQLAADGLKPTRQAQKECAEAMVKMLEVGWRKKDLDALEAIWWTVRNSDGSVRRKQP